MYPEDLPNGQLKPLTQPIETTNLSAASLALALCCCNDEALRSVDPLLGWSRWSPRMATERWEQTCII